MTIDTPDVDAVADAIIDTIQKAIDAALAPVVTTALGHEKNAIALERRIAALEANAALLQEQA